MWLQISSLRIFFFCLRILGTSFKRSRFQPSDIPAPGDSLTFNQLSDQPLPFHSFVLIYFFFFLPPCNNSCPCPISKMAFATWVCHLLKLLLNKPAFLPPALVSGLLAFRRWTAEPGFSIIPTYLALSGIFLSVPFIISFYNKPINISKLFS